MFRTLMSNKNQEAYEHYFFEKDESGKLDIVFKKIKDMNLTEDNLKRLYVSIKVYYEDHEEIKNLYGCSIDGSTCDKEKLFRFDGKNIDLFSSVIAIISNVLDNTTKTQLYTESIKDFDRSKVKIIMGFYDELNDPFLSDPYYIFKLV